MSEDTQVAVKPFIELAERIKALKTIESEASSERALLEAQMIARYISVSDKSTESVVMDGYKVEVTRSIDYKLDDLLRIKSQLSEEQFNIFCKITYEFSKSGYNALTKAAEAAVVAGGSGELSHKLLDLYTKNVIKNVRRPTVKVTEL